MSNAAAFVLAGGKSSRMGRDKAFILFNRETLLSRCMNLAGAVAERVTIVGDASKFSGFGSVIEDVHPGCGPLGGIHAALASSDRELNLILAVDLPFLESRLLEYLISHARKSAAMVTVPHCGGRFQPLCAVYRKEFALAAERALQAGDNRIDLLFDQTNTRVISDEELGQAGFPPGVFRNLNTPQELEEALRQIDDAGESGIIKRIAE